MYAKLGSYNNGDINVDWFEVLDILSVWIQHQFISEGKSNYDIFHDKDFDPSINQDDPFVETIYWEDNLMPFKVNNDYQDFDSVPEFQKQCDSLTMQSFYECQQQKIY